MATTRKRVQAYVNDATYHLLKSYAESEKISISEAASRLLQTYLTDGGTIPEHSASGGSSDFVTQKEFRDFSAQVYVELGRIEERYKAYSETIISTGQVMLSQALDMAQTKGFLPGHGDSDGNSDAKSSGEPSAARRKPSRSKPKPTR